MDNMLYEIPGLIQYFLIESVNKLGFQGQLMRFISGRGEAWRRFAQFFHVIIGFSRKDFSKRFTGSYLGVFWAFVQPVVMLLILWFLFTVGFKAGRVGAGRHPYFVWLASAMIVWTFFQESLTAATGVFVEYSFLVRKVHFRLEIMPVVKILSSLFIHAVFLLLLIVILLLHGYRPSLYWLQSFYYLLCAVLLTFALSRITATLHVFVRDVGQIVAVALQFGFWLTPIFWRLEMIPSSLHFLFRLNPLWYITEGYRRSFLYNQPVWNEEPFSIAVFWGIILILLLAGRFMFRRMRSHFADVL